MSYILDALRRAEHQRQQKQLQTIHSPVSPLEQEGLRRRRPLWLPLLLALLLGNGLLLMLWRHFAGAPPSVEKTPDAAEAQLIRPSSPASTPVVAAPPAPPTPPTDEAEEQELPPLLGELPLSVKQLLPPLGIQAHIHVRGAPTKSFVVLNQELLHEGERGAGGVQVVRIGSDEILLRYRKTEFRMKVRE